MRLAVVAGARPNFMKVAPILRAASELGHEALLLHTGQHYDDAMSASFFRDLSMRPPDANLGVGSGTQAEQTAKVMIGFESWLGEVDVDVVVVVGDVNSTVACTLVSAKLGLPVAHVEAGLRSFDRQMPEETNRIVVDGLASWLLTPSEDAAVNLLHEGVHPERIRFVGNVMVDSLYLALDQIDVASTHERLGVHGSFGLVTLHRPSLVDDPRQLALVMGALSDVSRELDLVFPVHPRTRRQMELAEIVVPPSIKLLEPLSYLDFVALESSARLVLTDSGGVQEETTCLGVQCLTLRASTERPITVTHGTNRVIGTDPTAIVPAVVHALAATPSSARPALWDGRAAQRIIGEIDRPVGAAA